jgi:hypothetical protein
MYMRVPGFSSRAPGGQGRRLAQSLRATALAAALRRDLPVTYTNAGRGPQAAQTLARDLLARGLPIGLTPVRE